MTAAENRRGANQMRVCRERVGATDDLGAE